jgi:glycosyltransferase involved in cell wall biosynthesis
MKKLEILNLGIQIVNYNTKKYITKCINSILKDLKRSQIKYHIFVVDNNSKDDLSDIKKKYKDEVVSFFSSERN